MFTLNSFSQEWIRIYGQGQNAIVRNVSEDYDKGFNILGMINDYKYLWLIKSDINGYLLRDKKIGNGTYWIWSSNIERTPDNGYIVCGTWTKFNNSFDAFIIKLNSCAEIEWCKTLITPTNYDMGIRVKPTPEGNYIILGGYFATNPYSNVSLFKLNVTGDLVWHQFFPLDSVYYEDQPYDLLVDEDGYLIVTDRYCPDSGTTGPAVIRHHFIKTDTAGNQVWELTYGVNNHFYGWPWTVKKDISGDYYEVGNHLYLNGTANPAFVKVNHNGFQSYYKDLLSGLIWGGLGSIDFLQDSLLVMVGRWYTDPNTAHDGFFKTDTLGQVKKIKEIFLLTNGYDVGIKTFDDKFLALGSDATDGNWKFYAVKVNSNLEYDSIYTNPFTYDSLCSYTIVSDTIDPDCNNVYVGIDEPFKDSGITKLNIFPNPATDHCTFKIPKYLVVTNTTSNISSTTIYHQWYSTILEVYDLFGRKMMEKEVIREITSVEIDVSRWPKGIYLCKLSFINKVVGSVKMIIK